jgi:hypothetical protein
MLLYAPHDLMLCPDALQIADTLAIALFEKR